MKLSFQLYLCVYVKPVFILVNETNKQIIESKDIPPKRRERSLSAQMEIMFTKLLHFKRMKLGMRNRKEFPGQVIGYLTKSKGF